MSLPPELGDLDDGWGEDEAPTIARPSRVPTAPVREPVPDIPTVPPLDIDIQELDDDAHDKETSVPEIPLDDYAKRMTGEGFSTLPPPEAPPPPGSEDEPQQDDSWDEMDLQAVGGPAEHPSELPTQPPPIGFDSREMDAQRPVTEPTGATPQSLDVPPPVASPAMAFSGRFSSAPPGEKSLASDMKDRFAMGDFSGALELAGEILKEHPSDQEASSLAVKCRDVLTDMYTSRINGLDRVPNVAMSPDQIRWLSLDHREGFLLSLVDGVSSVDELLDVSSMPRTDALRILCSLLDQKVISLS